MCAATGSKALGASHAKPSPRGVPRPLSEAQHAAASQSVGGKQPAGSTRSLLPRPTPPPALALNRAVLAQRQRRQSPAPQDDVKRHPIGKTGAWVWWVDAFNPSSSPVPPSPPAHGSSSQLAWTRWQHRGPSVGKQCVPPASDYASRGSARSAAPPPGAPHAVQPAARSTRAWSRLHAPHACAQALLSCTHA